MNHDLTEKNQIQTSKTFILKLSQNLHMKTKKAHFKSYIGLPRVALYFAFNN